MSESPHRLPVPRRSEHRCRESIKVNASRKMLQDDGERLEIANLIEA